MAGVKPKPIADLAEIYARVGDGWRCYYMPERMAMALAAIADQLKWDTRRIMPDPGTATADRVEFDIDATLDALGNPVPCAPFDPDDSESIIDWILNSEDIMITINNCNCCGCAACSSGPAVIPQDIFPDDWAPTYDDVDTEPDAPGDPGYLSAKCNAVHYFLYAYRLAALNWIDNVSSLVSFSDWWQAVTAPLDGPLSTPLGTAEYWSLVAMASGYVSPAGQFVTVYDAGYNALACELYTSLTPAEARGKFTAALTGMLSSLPAAARQPLMYISTLVPLEDAILNPESLALPVTHQGRTCDCGEFNPPVPAGLRFYDYTGTLGRLYHWTGEEWVQGSVDFDYNRTYWLRGDTAGHQDCEIGPAGGGPTIPDVVRMVVENPNVSPFTISQAEGGPVTIQPGESVEILTRQLDVNNYASGSHYMVVTPLELVVL